MTDAAELDTLRACFAGLWGLDDLSDSNTSDAVQAAIAEPDKYILKPQREGGGNNLYGVLTIGSVLERGERHAMIWTPAYMMGWIRASALMQGICALMYALYSMLLFGTHFLHANSSFLPDL